MGGRRLLPRHPRARGNPGIEPVYGDKSFSSALLRVTLDSRLRGSDGVGEKAGRLFFRHPRAGGDPGAEPRLRR
jgi:hypothetical protein